MKNFKANMPCLVCRESGENRVCWHHLKTRKSGGTDEEHNLMPLCLRHHNEVHAKGLVSFSEMYQGVREWLEDYGWERNPITQKWQHGGLA